MQTPRRPVNWHAALHKSRCFFVPNVNKANLVLLLSQCLEDAVDAIAWYSEKGVDAPGNKTFYEQIRNCFSHGVLDVVLVTEKS